MNEALFMRLAEEIMQERPESPIANLRGKEIITYTKSGFEGEAKRFQEKGGEGQYDLSMFLQDPNSPKTSYGVLEYASRTLNESIRGIELGDEAARALARMSLNYVYSASEGNPRGRDEELVMNWENTISLRRFASLANLYGQDSLEIILTGMSELFDSGMPHPDARRYAVKMRDAFLEAYELIQDMEPADLREVIGYGQSGERKGVGLLGYIEKAVSMGDNPNQPQIHQYVKSSIERIQN